MSLTTALWIILFIAATYAALIVYGMWQEWHDEKHRNRDEHKE